MKAGIPSATFQRCLNIAWFCSSLVNEEYCAAKRLYSAFNARSNNVGAAVTAASVAPVNRAVRQALNPLANVSISSFYSSLF